ncbi:hypothetical protein BGP_1771 [Beggiatoa sp. PS]|nr:hypothetical protein BGP_1771 [Beggiatoa sp. PS]
MTKGWMIIFFRVPKTEVNQPHCHLSIINYRLPITDYQLPITNYQFPITNFEKNNEKNRF